MRYYKHTIYQCVYNLLKEFFKKYTTMTFQGFFLIYFFKHHIFNVSGLKWTKRICLLCCFGLTNWRSGLLTVALCSRLCGSWMAQLARSSRCLWVSICSEYFKPSNLSFISSSPAVCSTVTTKKPSFFSLRFLILHLWCCQAAVSQLSCEDMFAYGRCE